jgi:hypothetical protein
LNLRPLGYESSEHRFAAYTPVRNQPIYRGLSFLPRGRRSALFLALSASLVSEA